MMRRLLTWIGTAVSTVLILSCSDSVGPGASGPSELVVVSGDGQEAQVGEVLSAPLRVRVTDADDNPLEGVAIRWWVMSGGGSADPTSSITDTTGCAEATWTLGTAAGANEMRVSVAGLSVTFEATAIAGAPSRLKRVSAENQSGEIGGLVPDPPAVRVVDEYENPVQGVSVQFVVVAGAGSVEGASAQSDTAGIARVGGWALGLGLGSNQLEACGSGLEPILFSAEGIIPPGFNLSVETVHLNQGNQAFLGDVGGIAERPGLLRVVVRANESNAHAPDVRLRLFKDETLLREVVIPATGAEVPVDPDPNDLSQTWNMQLSPGEVVQGLAVEVEVDPDETIPVSTRVDNRYPRGEGTTSLEVQPLPTLNVVFIPIHLTIRDETGNVHPDNTDTFLEATSQWIPSSEISAAVRAVYSTDLAIPEHEAWTTLLSEIRALRIAEGATDHYYVGIVRRFSGMVYRGLAYRLPSPYSTARAALAHDDLPEAASTLAHELGHNMGRMHAPCGDPSNVDPNYPYPTGIIGQPGWDILSGSILDSNEHFDFMSHCRPRWTSDYTFRSILEWRRDDPLAEEALSAAPGLASAEATTGLLVWGRINDREGVTLNPAFSLTARPVMPVAGGRHRLRGLADDGTELFQFMFDGVEVAVGPDPTERHFAYFVPLNPGEIDALERIEVSGPQGQAVRISPPKPPFAEGQKAPAPELRLQSLAGQRLRIHWRDADRYPMAMVRDRNTGNILSFARDGVAELSSAGVHATDLDVLLSDGLRSRPGGME